MKLSKDANYWMLFPQSNSTTGKVPDTGDPTIPETDPKPVVPDDPPA